MAVDVQTYPAIQEISRRVLLPEGERVLGAYLGGYDQSQVLGDGFDIDGLHDYDPAQDEARHIDWIKSASRADGGMYVRDHFVERAPLTVFVTDIASHRMAEAYGADDELTARALGFVASNILISSATRNGSPIYPFWSGSTIRASNLGSKVFEDLRWANRDIIKAGLDVGAIASEEALTYRKATAETKGFLKRKVEVAEVPKRPFSSVLQEAYIRSQRISSSARFIIVSEFQDNPDDIFEVMKRMRKSEVIAIQITNPHLFELPKENNIVQGRNASNIVIEGEEVRRAYANRAAIRQGMIQENLETFSTHTTSIDTSNVGELVKLTRLGHKVKH